MGGDGLGRRGGCGRNRRVGSLGRFARVERRGDVRDADLHGHGAIAIFAGHRLSSCKQHGDGADMKRDGHAAADQPLPKPRGCAAPGNRPACA